MLVPGAVLFFILQYPLADTRGFLDSAPGRLSMPNWPSPALNCFVRHFGKVQPRWRGGVNNWMHEDILCDARWAVRFPKDSVLNATKRPVPYRVHFRRLYSDNCALAKIEIGIGVRRLQSPLTPQQTRELVHSLLETDVTVTLKPSIKRNLISAGAVLASHYQRSTTTNERLAQPMRQRWVISGTPLLLLESRAAEHVGRPFQREYLTLPNPGIAVSHSWERLHGKDVRFWHIEESEATARKASRLFRIALMRLHAEREVLRLVLHEVEKGEVLPNPRTDASNRLQRYFGAATNRILDLSKDVQAEPIVAIASEVADQARPGERGSLRESLEQQLDVRPQIAVKLLKFKASERPRLLPDELAQLIQIFADLVRTEPNPRKAVTGLLAQCELSEQIGRRQPPLPVGDVDAWAADFVDWAIAAGLNSRQPDYYVLGSLLLGILDALEAPSRAFVIALISCRQLIASESRSDDFASAFLLTQQPFSGKSVSYGPHFVWQGPPSPSVMELQAWRRAQDEFVDVGFQQRSVQASESVCRVEVDRQDAATSGTGFVIAPGIVVTCFHVINTTDPAFVRNHVKLRFGALTMRGGQQSEGRLVHPGDDPVIAADSRLDFIAIRTKEPTDRALDMIPAGRLPVQGTSIHILQHPEGGPMKLSTCLNSVTTILPEHFQYHTPTRSGSSGAPCFDDDWNVIGLHQSEQTITWGIGQMFSAGSQRQGLIGEILRRELVKLNIGVS